MRVKLCARCPYTPQNLDGDYDPEAALHFCARCDGEERIIKMHYPREAYRRRKCSRAPNMFSMAQSIAAQSVAESSVLSVTIPGERPSVRRTALIASRFVGRAIANGCTCFEPPETISKEMLEGPSSRSGSRTQEPAQ